MIRWAVVAAVVAVLVGCGGSPSSGSSPAPVGSSVTPCGTGTAAQGDEGPAGPAGAQGPQGPQGAPGATGATGAEGAPGPAGSAGPAGPIGPAGAQGPAGPQGPAGAAFSTSNVYQAEAPGVGQPRGSFSTIAGQQGMIVCGYETAQCAAGDILLSGSCSYTGLEVAQNGQVANGGNPVPTLAQAPTGAPTGYQCATCIAATATPSTYPTLVQAIAVCYHPA